MASRTPLKSVYVLGSGPSGPPRTRTRRPARACSCSPLRADRRDRRRGHGDRHGLASSARVRRRRTEYHRAGRPVRDVISAGSRCRRPVVVGPGGRVPPTTVIEDDALRQRRDQRGVRPGHRRHRLLESARGRCASRSTTRRRVGPTNPFGETPVRADYGASASATTRGGIVLRADDANPERFLIDDDLSRRCRCRCRRHLRRRHVGVAGLQLRQLHAPADAAAGRASRRPARRRPREPQRADAAGGRRPSTSRTSRRPTRRPSSTGWPAVIVHNLAAPDIIALEEIQDNTGATDDGIVAADRRSPSSSTAITAAGGPTYECRADRPGQRPGRRPARRQHPRRSSCSAPTAGSRSSTGRAARRRRDRRHPAAAGTAAADLHPRAASTRRTRRWTTSRKPLAGEFLFRRADVFVIANHFNSKGGDEPLFGRFQPPVRSRSQRHQQATIVHDFVDQILARGPAGERRRARRPERLRVLRRRSTS